MIPAFLNKKRTHVFLAISFLINSFLLALAHPTLTLGAIQDYRYKARIVPVTSDTIVTPYSLLVLPDEVLGQARTNTPDIRIYSEEEEIPYAQVPVSSSGIEARREKFNILNSGRDSIGNQVFEVNLPKDYWVNELSLLTSDKNFIRKVKVEGSRDQVSWINLQGNSTIFDLSNEKKAKNTNVHFSKTNFPYLRVTIFNEGNPALTLNGVELTILSTQENLGELSERPYQIVTSDLKDGIQEILLELNYSNLPVNELEFLTDSQNFSRRVEIYGSEKKENWKLLVQGEIYSYQLDKASADQRVLKFKATSRFLRVKINNEDNNPINLKGLKLRGINPMLVLPTNPKKQYLLYWGNESIKAPIYDLDKLLINMDYSKMSNLKLEKGELNELFKLTDTRPWSERNSWLLNLLLIMLVLVLVILITRNFRKFSN